MKWYEWGMLTFLAVFFAGNIVMGAVGTEYNSGPLGFGKASTAGASFSATRPKDKFVFDGASGARVVITPSGKKIRILGNATHFTNQSGHRRAEYVSMSSARGVGTAGDGLPLWRGSAWPGGAGTSITASDKQIIFSDGANNPTGAAIYWDKTNIRLGNVASPSIGLDWQGDSTQTQFRLTNTAASGAGVGPSYRMYADDGSALASGDRLGFVVFGGAGDASHNLYPGARIDAYAAGAWSGSSSPGDLAMFTTASGAVSATERFRIQSNGVQTTNALTTRTSASKVLTDDTSTSIIEIALADGQMVCGWIEYCAHSTDGTDMVIHRGRVSFAATSKSGTQTADIAHNHETGSSNVATGGATFVDNVSGSADLANAGGWGIQSGTGKITLKYRGNASITSTGYPLLKYTINLQGTNTMTPL